MTLTMTNPAPYGFINDLDEQEYHTHQGSLSVSGAKTLLKAPALFRYQQDHPVYRDVFDFGSAAHALVLGVGANLAVYSGATDWRSKEARAFRDEARVNGDTPLLEVDYERVQAMAEALKDHRLAMQLLSNGQPEVSAFAIDEPTGVLRRGRFDYLGPSVVTDFKTAASAEPSQFAASAARYGYHQQAAWYLDLVRDLGHPADAFAFLVQEKEAPYLVSVIELDADAINRGRELNRRALEIYRDCTTTDLWPSYVADGGFARVSLPKWAFYDNDTETF